MPGRGLLTVACLVLIALACISIVRKLERERRLLGQLRARGAHSPETGLALKDLHVDDRDCLRSLQSAGGVSVSQGRCYLDAASLPPFRRRRVRLALSGALIALLLAVLIASAILR